MVLLSADKLLNELPKLFEIDLISDKNNLFKCLEKFINFNEGFVFYCNSDSLQLKYSYHNTQGYTKDTVIKLTPEEKLFIFSPDGSILDKNNSLIEKLNSSSNQNSFIISKIAVKSTVFGIILLSFNQENYYHKEDLRALNTASSIIAYLIKDAELSNVFKIQLRALKDGIIEKNEAYETIKVQNEKILEADRVKNEFLANISHELRTPLNSILGFADILSTQLYGNLNSKQLEYIEDIKASGTHLLGMINEILDMSKIEAHAMKIVKSTFWISRAVDEVSNILMPLARKKNINIAKKIENDFQVFADYQKIQQILYNLVSNAIKYSPDSDTVEICVFNNGDTFKITVHDNGIGIDKKYHGKIFAKFVQLDSAYTKKESSTGLGLTITKELVELHEGKISLISEVNNGSTFIVEIPF